MLVCGLFDNMGAAKRARQVSARAPAPAPPTRAPAPRSDTAKKCCGAHTRPARLPFDLLVILMYTTRGRQSPRAHCSVPRHQVRCFGADEGAAGVVWRAHRVQAERGVAFLWCV